MSNPRGNAKRHFMLLAGTSLTALIAFGACAHAQEVEEVTVSGIKESIEHSIAMKRDSATVMDVITAEDIGKLPDQNIVDTLQRITGVQIDRGGRGAGQQSTLGEGTGFTIRGIGQNRVEFNGTNLTGAGDSGSVQLGDFNPEILAGLTVTKSPSAETVEGAIGGVVNLITKKPLDLDNFFASGRIEGIYLDQAKKTGYRGSAMASMKFFGDTFGILMGASRYDYNRENEQANTDGWVQTNGIDGNGDGVKDPNLTRPNRAVFDSLYANIQRTGLNGSLQWKPSSDFELNFDAGYTQVDLTQDANRFQILLTDAVTGAQTDQNGTVVRGTYTAPTIRPAIYDEETHSTQSIFSLYGKWTPYSDWLIEARGAHSTGDYSVPLQTPLLVPKSGRTATVTTDFASGADVFTTIVNSNFNIGDYSNYQLASLVDTEDDRTNTGDDARLDVTYDTDWGWLSSLKVGGRYENLNFATTGKNSNLTGAQIIALTPSVDRNKDGQVGADEIAGLTYGGLPTNNFLSGATGTFPRTWLAGADNPAAVRTGFGLPTPPLDLTRVRAVQQDTTAFYAQANLAGEIFGLEADGNFGIRYVTTSRDASGYIISPTGATPSASAANFNDILPSANLKVNLSENLLVRFAAAKVLARPDLGSVSPTTSLNIVSFTASQGNPNLNPYRATQFDTSLEWYFAPASVLSAAAFYKDVNSFTVNVTTSQFFNNPPNSGNYLVTQPQNGSNGSIKGLEIGYQQVFQDMPKIFDGLGGGLSYTFVESDTPIVNAVTQVFDPIPGLSKHSLNATLFLEQDWGNVRLTYNWRSKYLDKVQSSAVGGDLYQGSYGQLDFSSQFVLTDQIKLNIEAVNLTKQPETAYSVFPNRFRDYSVNDRRIYFGVSASL
jgi:TonB-dependent receptor